MLVQSITLEGKERKEKKKVFKLRRINYPPPRFRCIAHNYTPTFN